MVEGSGPVLRTNGFVPCTNGPDPGSSESYGSGSATLLERAEGVIFLVQKSGKLRVGFWPFLFWPCLSTLVRLNQGFGSGSVLDPSSIGPVDPDPYSESGSGSRRAKMTHKGRKNSCFEVLDGLFCELQASSVTWTYFMEA